VLVVLAVAFVVVTMDAIVVVVMFPPLLSLVSV
jgi:hypothetical protein